MRFITAVIGAFFSALLLYSCTADDRETTSFEKQREVPGKNDCSVSTMQRDTIFKEEDGYEPPIIKPVKL